MKRFLSIFTIMLLGVFGVINVANAETYYRNENGVEFTETEYKFFTKMFYDGYQRMMTQEMFDSYDKDYMNENLVETTEITGPLVSPIGGLVDTPAKTLRMSVIQTTTFANVGVTVVWKGSPAMRSYDVMGAYLSSVSLKTPPSTLVDYSTGYFAANDVKNESNGFGVTIKLPDSGTNINITQSYVTSLGGEVYGSYQHALDKVTFADSQNYTINFVGYGNVFMFPYSVGQHYDMMDGVWLEV